MRTPESGRRHRPATIADPLQRRGVAGRLPGMNTAAVGRHLHKWLSRMTPPVAAPLLVTAPLLVAALALGGCAGPETAAPPSLSAALHVKTNASSPEPAAQNPADVTAECTYRSTTGLTMGLTDTGFGLGTVTFAPQPDSLCFFDGRSWWWANLIDAPIRAARLTGVGLFLSQAAGQGASTGRFLFGLTGSADTTIHVTVDGAPVEPIIVTRYSPSTTELPILARVPATGTVVVTATAKDGTVLQTVPALPADSDTAAASERTDQRQEVAGVLIATFIPPDDTSMPEELADGTLTLGPDGCLYIGENGPVAVWKAQSQPTAILGEDDVIHVYQDGNDAARVGGVISATGGGTTTPPGCDTTRGGFEIYQLDAE